MFGAKKTAEGVLAEALLTASRPYDDPVVAEYMRVRDRINDLLHNRPPGASAKRPDDIDPQLWAAVDDYYSRDEEFALQLLLTTISLANKYRLTEDAYADAVTAAYRLGSRLPQVRAALGR